MAVKQYTEEYYLKISLITSIFSVAILLFVGFYSRSQATFLNGVLGLIDIVTTLAVMGVVQMLKRPATPLFPFGFYKLEPMIAAFESGLIVVTCIQGMIQAFVMLIHGVHQEQYFNGFILMTVNAFINFIAFYWMHKAYKSIKSQVIQVEYQGWLIETITETVLWASFLFGCMVYFFRWDSIKPYLPYLDPLLTIMVALSVLKEPLTACVGAVKDLIDVKPELEKQDDEIVAVAHEVAKHLGFSLEQVKLIGRRAGRASFLSLFYTPKADVAVNVLLDFDARLNQEASNLLALDNNQEKVIFKSILIGPHQKVEGF